MKIYILIVFLFIIFAIGLRYWFTTKEGNSPKRTQIRSGHPKNDPNNEDYYYAPRQEQISESLRILDNLKSTMPVTFGAGNISYEKNIEAPVVTFSGEIPYIFINIKLPYPSAGDQGQRGEKGDQGPDGKKGEQGDKGKPGYIGSNFIPWSFRS
jgi:hypothetical protein